MSESTNMNSFFLGLSKYLRVGVGDDPQEHVDRDEEHQDHKQRKVHRTQQPETCKFQRGFIKKNHI